MIELDSDSQNAETPTEPPGRGLGLCCQSPTLQVSPSHRQQLRPPGQLDGFGEVPRADGFRAGQGGLTVSPGSGHSLRYRRPSSVQRSRGNRHSTGTGTSFKFLAGGRPGSQPEPLAPSRRHQVPSSR